MRLSLTIITVISCLLFSAASADAASSRSSSSCSSKTSMVCKTPTSKKAVKKAVKKAGAAVSSARAKVKTTKSASSAKLKTAAPSVNCTIKGNISATKEKIFHVIGCPNYNQTIIETGKGETMFCSEAEAKKAGWRKALNCPK